MNQEVSKMAESSVRLPICADDRWYPSRTAALRDDVSGYIERGPVLDLPGRVIGLVAPHAGYFFSGHVAGAAYRQVRGGDYDTVVVVGPDHRGITAGGLAYADFDAWRTPLGEVPVDRDLLAAMGRQVKLRPVERDDEHSLEVQLPFLQVALSDFRLVPIMMGDIAPETCRKLGLAIAEGVRGRRALLVASTDLSHYYDDQTARRLDQKTVQFMLDFDPDSLAGALGRGAAQACGGGPVAAVMAAARELGAAGAHLVKYATSGDVWEDRSQVVGYAALVLTRQQ
jgi:AmmeMemoRadiSam system protein B